MPTIVPGAAQCDLGQSGAPTALLRDCTIVLVWPVTGSYSTARSNYSVKNRAACGRVPRCLHGSLSLSHRVVSEWRPPSRLLAVRSRLMCFWVLLSAGCLSVGNGILLYKSSVVGECNNVMMYYEIVL